VVASLDRFEHYMSLTVEGRRVGPVRITGPHLDEAFADLARPGQVAALERAARATAGAASLETLTDRAADQLARVSGFLAQHANATSSNVQLNKKGYK
jgi:hypothetical protein